MRIELATRSACSAACRGRLFDQDAGAKKTKKVCVVMFGTMPPIEALSGLCNREEWPCLRGVAMFDMSQMPTAMMLGMGIYHLLIAVFAVVGIAAGIKYLRS